jgi:hypothetical protein
MQRLMKEQYIQIFAWALSFLTTLTAFLVWGDSVRWRFTNLSNYRLFPLFGLLAFSLMWGHYIVAAFRRHFGVERQYTRTYFAVTSYGVLLAILLHPGILWWQLWRDGLGLPPKSYLSNYVAPSMAWIALLGTVSLFVFLAYEFHRKFGDRKWWRFVQYSSDAAMLAIFYHGLRLGNNLQRGWFKGLWLFYGATLIAALIYIYMPKPSKTVKHSVAS